MDFARFRFPWGVRYALLVVLGYSRLRWCRFYPRQDMRTLVSELEEAFHYLGGVPRELLFEQMKAVITRDLRLGRAPPQCGVPPVRAALGLQAAGLSPVPRADEGQSGAAGAIRTEQFVTAAPSCTTPISITSGALA